MGASRIEEGGQCEADHANQQQTLATKSAGEPSRHRKDDGVRDQIGGDDPRALVDAGGEVAGDVGDGNVDDGGVEQLHEGGEHHGDGDDPGVDVGVFGMGRVGGAGHRSG